MGNLRCVTATGNKLSSKLVFDNVLYHNGGIAPGIDRLIMYLTDDDNVREVIVFPKSGGGFDPMMDAPSEVEPKQLGELGITVKPTPKKEEGTRT